MLCENSFCIYWSCNHCILDHVALDAYGSCQECIYVEIEESILQEKRQTVLTRLQCEESKWKKE